MSRPTKCRMICRFPQTSEFVPAKNDKALEPVILTMDEYEAIRLIDKENMSQEQCSKHMNIARTTVQKIYESARKKIANVLVDGLPLKIDGGEYQLCTGNNRFCNTEECYKQEIYKNYQKPKGEKIMRIAVTYENGQIFQHFGHTEKFKVYDIEDNKIVSSEIVDTMGQGHGALAEVLRALQTDVLICGGIGGGAKTALANMGIQLYGGVSGSADAAAEALIAGKLEYNPNIQCSHHHGEHHHESCGEHHHGDNHQCRHGNCGN